MKYKSFPPTSGAHYFQPAIWNAYEAPLVLVQEVHNLEHGGVVIQYGKDVPPAESFAISTARTRTGCCSPRSRNCGEESR